MSRFLLTLAFVSLTLGATACAPQIGDACTTSADCDVNGQRVCDNAQPGGYCTVGGCEKGTCPQDSTCVEFRPEPERLSSSWCMATCEDDGDCRADESYRCTFARDLGEGIAVALDGEAARFCAYVPPSP